MNKLNSLSEESYMELTATTKRRKLTERDHSIKIKLKQAKDACLAKAKEQAKQRVANEKKKQNEKKRKAENHHKYIMGGIIVKPQTDALYFFRNE